MWPTAPYPIWQWPSAQVPSDAPNHWAELARQWASNHSVTSHFPVQQWTGMPQPIPFGAPPPPPPPPPPPFSEPPPPPPPPEAVASSEGSATVGCDGGGKMTGESSPTEAPGAFVAPPTSNKMPDCHSQAPATGEPNLFTRGMDQDDRVLGGLNFGENASEPGELYEAALMRPPPAGVFHQQYRLPGTQAALYENRHFPSNAYGSREDYHLPTERDCFRNFDESWPPDQIRNIPPNFEPPQVFHDPGHFRPPNCTYPPPRGNFRMPYEAERHSQMVNYNNCNQDYPPWAPGQRDSWEGRREFHGPPKIKEYAVYNPNRDYTADYPPEQDAYGTWCQGGYYESPDYGHPNATPFPPFRRQPECHPAEEGRRIIHPSHFGSATFPAGHAPSMADYQMGPPTSVNINRPLAASRLSIPDHLISAFEEAAASTGAWPPPDTSGSASTSSKRKVLPAWLRDELERLEKKKAKEIATSGPGKGTSPNLEADRDDEGDVVMTEADGDAMRPSRATAAAYRSSQCPSGASDEDSETLNERDSHRGLFDGNSLLCSGQPNCEGIKESKRHSQLSGLSSPGSDRPLEEDYLPEASPETIAVEEFRLIFSNLPEEAKQAEITQFITRTLTEALLTVTTEMLVMVVEEVYAEARTLRLQEVETATRMAANEQRAAIARAAEKKVKETPPISCSGAGETSLATLPGLVAYATESDTDSEAPKTPIDQAPQGGDPSPQHSIPAPTEETKHLPIAARSRSSSTSSTASFSSPKTLPQLASPEVAPKGLLSRSTDKVASTENGSEPGKKVKSSSSSVKSGRDAASSRPRAEVRSTRRSRSPRPRRRGERSPARHGAHSRHAADSSRSHRRSPSYRRSKLPHRHRGPPSPKRKRHRPSSQSSTASSTSRHRRRHRDRSLSSRRDTRAARRRRSRSSSTEGLRVARR